MRTNGPDSFHFLFYFLCTCWDAGQHETSTWCPVGTPTRCGLGGRSESRIPSIKTCNHWFFSDCLIQNRWWVSPNAAATPLQGPHWDNLECSIIGGWVLTLTRVDPSTQWRAVSWYCCSIDSEDRFLLNWNLKYILVDWSGWDSLWTVQIISMRDLWWRSHILIYGFCVINSWWVSGWRWCLDFYLLPDSWVGQNSSYI